MSSAAAAGQFAHQVVRQHYHDDPSPNGEGTIGGVTGGNGPGPASDDALVRDRSRCGCGLRTPA
ncbi:hypothetical protein ABH935_006805 [Catenulispora sp. GAS73]